MALKLIVLTDTVYGVMVNVVRLVQLGWKMMTTVLKWVAGNLLLVHHLMIVMTAIY